MIAFELPLVPGWVKKIIIFTKVLIIMKNHNILTIVFVMSFLVLVSYILYHKVWIGG